MIFDFFPYSGVRCGPARPLCNRREKSINSPKKGPDCFVNVGLASSSRKRYLASTIFHSCRKWQQKHHSWSRLSCARALSYRRHGGCLCIVHTLCRRCPRSYRDVHCDSVQCTNRNHGDFAVLFISWCASLPVPSLRFSSEIHFRRRFHFHFEQCVRRSAYLDFGKYCVHVTTEHTLRRKRKKWSPKCGTRRFSKKRTPGADTCVPDAYPVFTVRQSRSANRLSKMSFHNVLDGADSFSRLPNVFIIFSHFLPFLPLPFVRRRRRLNVAMHIKGLSTFVKQLEALNYSTIYYMFDGNNIKDFGNCDMSHQLSAAYQKTIHFWPCPRMKVSKRDPNKGKNCSINCQKFNAITMWPKWMHINYDV